MILFLVLALTALSVALLVGTVIQLVPSRPPALSRRLRELEAERHHEPGSAGRRRRQIQSERLTAVLQALGTKVQEGRTDVSALRLRLIQAGYPEPGAVPLYFGARLGLPMALGAGSLVVLPAWGFEWGKVLLVAVWLGVIGYVLPSFFIGGRVKRRQKEMQKALPDALDLMVVCVEAGLALNQAMVRVSEEIERVSPVLSEQIALVNLEIRAGTPRDEAFRNLGERTGLQDIKSLMAMLIQTDRFGTSIATALRVHADTLRTKRRQRAEEAAAKTTIKLVFPLVFFIFPAMFVVLIGPALIEIFKALTAMS
jgi:tight adherence protein C